MNEIQVFNSPMFGEVRVNEDVNGDVWFCGMDVCNALGYENERKSHDNSWTGSQTLITTKGRELFRELFNPARISFKNIAAHKSVTQRIKNFFGFSEDKLGDGEVLQSDYAE